MEVNEGNGNGGSVEEVDLLDLEVNEVGVMNTPLNDVLEVDVLGDGFVDGENAATPVRCVVESDDGVYEELLEHPQVGMVFGSWEDADKFFRKYGKQRGFGVFRAAGNFKTENGKTDYSQRRSYIWQCECAGKPDLRRRVNGKRVYGGGLSLDLNRRKTKKCGCPVEMRAVCKPDGLWEVKKAITEHENHKPTPRKSRYISMYRQDEITNAVRRRLFNDCSAGTQVTQVHRSMAKERGGVENMAVTERDLRNVLAREKKMKMLAGDANAMLAYFDKMCSDNQNFFHKYRLDDEGRLTDVMWVDARSRVAYEEFGDVVCFDSTYVTNEYALPFANFVGVNHHGQTILLGCALVSHENTETFEWLFSNWLHCMGGKQPVGFLTDQCAAMRKPLSTVMPKSRHRWCLWHIVNKFGTKLGSYAKYQEFHDVLLNVIYDSLTEDEFELNWTLAMEAYGLGSDEWLSGLYEERHMWIPAYMKHLFWAGMKTTQRSESINSFFDKYVKRDTRLFEFAERYCDAMENRANAEKEADANSAIRLRHAITGFSYEKTFQKVYTDAKFVEIQEQCTRLMYLSVVGKREVSDKVVEHLVQDRVWFFDKELKKEIPMDRKIVYTVTFNYETKDALCECKLFECHGIMCRHQFKVFDDNAVKEVPSKYILQRWRKDVNRRHTRVKVAYHDPSKTEEVKRYDRIMVKFENVCLKAASRPKYVQLAFEAISKLEKSLDEALQKEQKETDNTDAVQKGTPDAECENTDVLSCPSVNKDYVGPVGDESGLILHSDIGDSFVNDSSVLGLEDISINPVENTGTPMMEGCFSGSSVNENSMSKPVHKPLSVGDPVSRKKAHRPKAKRYLSFAEKCGKKTANARTNTNTNNLGNCGAGGVTVPVLKGTKKRGRPRKAKQQEQGQTAAMAVEHGSSVPMWVGGIGYGPAYGELGYFTRSIQSCPEWVARDVLPYTSAASWSMNMSGSSYVQQL